MSAQVVKMTGNKDDTPVILQVGPDKDILKLGLPNTLRIGPGKVPTMYLLLRGSHYDLAISRESITNKYTSLQESDEINTVENEINNEMENLQDLLVETGQENERLKQKVRELLDQYNQVRTEQMEETTNEMDNEIMKKRLIENNLKILNMEIENIKISQKAEYFKAQNEQAAKHLREIDQQYIESKKTV